LTKVSVYVDDSVWLSFKKQTFQKYGSLRKLSSEVEILLRDAVVEGEIISAFEKTGVTVKGTISSEEIKKKRPKLKGVPSEVILGEMRRKRIAEALPRQ